MQLYPAQKIKPETRKAVQAAIDAVRKYHPDVDQVFFGWDGRWLYCDEHFEAPTFSDEIDIGVLEDASDAVANDCGFPAAFAFR